MPAHTSIWSRIPVLARAPLTALAVLVAAVYPTSFLMQLNLAILPGVPWAVVPGAVYLRLLWRYVGGWGAPARTGASRLRYRRFNPVPATGRPWIWLAGAALGVTLAGYSMIKLMTAFFEEAAFPGYMQIRLEDRYRPGVVIQGDIEGNAHSA